jgi:hypothetical protein
MVADLRGAHPVTRESQLFLTPEQATEKEEKRFGWRYNGRYHMPLLDGEEGVKSVPKGKTPWVPYGVQSATNLIDAFEESRALNEWEQTMMALGLVFQPSLYEKLTLIVQQAQRDGLDLTRPFQYPELRKAITGGWDRAATEVSILGQAKQVAGGNEAREAGTNRHNAWEIRVKTGELSGTPEMQRQILELEALLERYQLQVMPELSERVVRNTVVNASGRFDNVLFDMVRRRYLMADLKTKRTGYRSYMGVDGQLWIYAGAEWMLDWPNGFDADPVYIKGPLHYVDQTEGVVLMAPSDGKPPYLRRADLTVGRRVAKLARAVVEERKYGKSVERAALAEWPLPVDNSSTSDRLVA